MNQKQLEEVIKYHQEKYYNGETEITDAEFDEYWDELKLKYPKSELLVKVGETSWDGFKKEKHIMPMCSQQKAGTIDEFEKWNSNQLHSKRLIEHKCDGISLSVQYENGNFVRALTRGDGDFGDDISKNVGQMDGFKNNITNSYFTGGVRCEIVMLRSVFDKKYKGIKKNPRNTASGIAKQKDGNNYGDVTLIYYDVKSTSDLSFQDETNKLNFLKENFGEKYLVWNRIVDANEVTSIRNQIMENRESVPYDIDGLVIKNIEIDEDDMARTTPMNQIAYKFETEKVGTRLIGVEWSAKGKFLTPVGMVEPVELNGTTVKRASLANFAIMNELNLKIGDVVEITKRGEIIPKIERVILHEGKIDIKVPTHCECGTELKNDDVFIYCPNKNCHLKAIHKLIKWVNVLDVKYMGTNMITRLFEKGLIKNISDFYTRDLEDIISAMENDEGFSRRNITKAFTNLYNVSNVTLPQFIGGYDLEGVGQRVIENIIDNSELKTLDNFLLLSANQLAHVKQVGAIKARQIFDGLHENNLDMLATLNSGKVEIIVPQKSSDRLKGMSFCITGKLKYGIRDEYIEKIKDNGGQYKGVSRDLTYLINNDTTSSSGKNKKAKELNIPIISEDEFLKILTLSK